MPARGDIHDRPTAACRDFGHAQIIRRAAQTNACSLEVGIEPRPQRGVIGNVLRQRIAVIVHRGTRQVGQLGCGQRIADVRRIRGNARIGLDGDRVLVRPACASSDKVRRDGFRPYPVFDKVGRIRHANRHGNPDGGIAGSKGRSPGHRIDGGIVGGQQGNFIPRRYRTGLHQRLHIGGQTVGSGSTRPGHAHTQAAARQSRRHGLHHRQDLLFRRRTDNHVTVRACDGRVVDHGLDGSCAAAAANLAPERRVGVIHPRKVNRVLPRSPGDGIGANIFEFLAFAGAFGDHHHLACNNLRRGRASRGVIHGTA